MVMFPFFNTAFLREKCFIMKKVDYLLLKNVRKINSNHAISNIQINFYLSLMVLRFTLC